MNGPGGLVMALAVSALEACTLEPGTGFATLTEARVEASFQPGEARDLGGSLLTAQGYTVQVDELVVGLGSISLEQLEGTAGGTFDPADPPEGYSLCHGGHCHSDDGGLVSYAEIQAELAGGTVRLKPLVTLPVEREVDLLAEGGTTVELNTVVPSRHLPRGSIDRVQVGLDSLTTTARFVGEPFTLEEETLLTVELPLAEALAVTAHRPLERDQPGEIHLVVTLTLDGTFYDGLNLATLAEGGPVAVTDPATEPGATLVSALLAAALEVSFD